MNEIEKIVKEVVAEVSDSSIQKIELTDIIGQSKGDNSERKNYLELDSLDMVGIIMEVEKETGISISDETAENIVTVGDLVKLTEELMKKQ